MFKKIIAGLTVLIMISAITIVLAQPKTSAKESERSNLLVVQTQRTEEVKPDTAVAQLSYLQLFASRSELTVGDTIQMNVSANIPSLLPQDLVYSVDTLNATIDQDGYLLALTAGEATVKVASASAKLEASFTFVISDAIAEEEPAPVKTTDTKISTPAPTPTPNPTPTPTPVTTVSVSSVSLQSSVTSLFINKSVGLSVSVSPANATDKSVTFKTSNAEIATVSSTGSVTAKSSGDVTITVTTNDGKFSDSVTITVKSAVSSVPESDWKLEVARLTNIEREKAGVSILKYNDYIAAGAQTRSEELLTSFSHTRPDGSRFFTVFDDPDFSYRYIGENLALGYKSPAEVVAAWMKSDGHRANLLSDKYSDIGIGITKSESGRYHWAQIFYKGK